MLSAEINASSDRLRRYIAALETECDPAGTIRENFRLREENAGLRIECENLAKEHKMSTPPDYAVYGPTEDECGPSMIERRPLKCSGVGRDKDCISALQFYFSRPVTDDEMRFLHEVVRRAAVCMPATLAARVAKADFIEKLTPGFIAFDEQTCPGHVASKDDPKVCGRCGTHIDAT